MNSTQKVQKIVDYYRSMRDSDDDYKDDDSSAVPSTTGGFSIDDDAENSNILVNWRLL